MPHTHLTIKHLIHRVDNRIGRKGIRSSIQDPPRDRLSKLPPELQTIIYEQVLTDAIYSTSSAPNLASSLSGYRALSSLSRTSRTLHHIVSPLLHKLFITSFLLVSYVLTLSIRTGNLFLFNRHSHYITDLTAYTRGDFSRLYTDQPADSPIVDKRKFTRDSLIVICRHALIVQDTPSTYNREIMSTLMRVQRCTEWKSSAISNPGAVNMVEIIMIWVNLFCHANMTAVELAHMLSIAAESMKTTEAGVLGHLSLRREGNCFWSPALMGTVRSIAGLDFLISRNIPISGALHNAVRNSELQVIRYCLQRLGPNIISGPMLQTAISDELHAVIVEIVKSPFSVSYAVKMASLLGTHAILETILNHVNASPSVGSLGFDLADPNLAEDVWEMILSSMRIHTNCAGIIGVSNAPSEFQLQKRAKARACFDAGVGIPRSGGVRNVSRRFIYEGKVNRWIITELVERGFMVDVKFLRDAIGTLGGSDEYVVRVCEAYQGGLNEYILYDSVRYGNGPGVLAMGSPDGGRTAAGVLLEKVMRNVGQEMKTEEMARVLMATLGWIVESCPGKDRNWERKAMGELWGLVNFRGVGKRVRREFDVWWGLRGEAIGRRVNRGGMDTEGSLPSVVWGRF